MRKKSILHNPLTLEQQQQALQQAHEPITQQPTPANYGMLQYILDFFTVAYLHPFESTLKSVRLRIHPDFFFISPQATFFHLH